MATLDFNLLGLNQPTPAERFLQGQQEAQRNMLAQQQLQQAQLQTESSRMQLEQAKRDREALDNMAKLFAQQGHTGSLSENFDKMIASGIPQYVQIGITGKQKLAEQEQFARIMGGGAPAAAPTPAAPVGGPAMTPAPAIPSPVRNALGLAAAPAATPAAPANALVAPPADVVGQMRAKRDQLLALGTPQAIAAAKALDTDIAAAQRQHVATPGSIIFDAQGRQIAAVPLKEPTATAVTEYNFAKTPEGGGFKGSFQDFLTARARAGATPAQPQPPVAVVDPKTNKTVFVTREEAISKRMTPATAMEGLAPKEIQKREAALPQAKASVTGFESKTDQFIKDLEKLRDDPGLNDITGPIYGRTPSVSRAGSRAQASYNKIFAKGGFQGLQDLREASKTGGALGNVSNEEGRRLEASVVGGLDRTQHIDDVKAGINALIEDLKVSKARVRNTFDETYSYKQSDGAAPAAKAMTPQDQEALRWANANANDPRAAQIKARLGVQ